MLMITLPIASLRVFNIRPLLVSGVLLLNLLSPSFAQAGRVRSLFSLDTMAGTPFPSDLFTVADPTQNTGLRVNLPKPDCLARPSDCQDLDVINTLDGFNLQPRLSIPIRWPDRCHDGDQRNGFSDQPGRHARSERPGWSPCRD